MLLAIYLRKKKMSEEKDIKVSEIDFSNFDDELESEKE